MSRKYRDRLPQFPKGHDEESAHADSRDPSARRRTDDMLNHIESWLQEQKDGVRSIAQSSFTTHQAKRGKILANELSDWLDWGYEIGTERSHSYAKKTAGRKSGHDVGDR